MLDCEIGDWNGDEEVEVDVDGEGEARSEERILIPPFTCESAVAWWPRRISK